MSCNVLVISSWNTPGCGIEEHTKLLIEAVERVDPTWKHYVDPEFLDPGFCFRAWGTGWPITVLNYHRALHSRWTPTQVARLKERTRVICVFHDTFGENSPDDLTLALSDLADAFIVHEPCKGLPKAIYWRMGVPEPARLPIYVCTEDGRPLGMWYRPVLGSIGFPFGWKNYDQLCDLTAQAGWALLLIAPTATDAQIAEWTQRQPHLYVEREFVPQAHAISLLSGCDATMFAYVCGNSGQSAAIDQGIAARKPVLALATCRQFRALYQDPLGSQTIWWAETFEELAERLRRVPIQRTFAPIVALAEQESWVGLGRRYAALYRRVASVQVRDIRDEV